MTNPMIDGKRADSARHRERVLKAIDAAKSGLVPPLIGATGQPPTGTSVPCVTIRE